MGGNFEVMFLGTNGSCSFNNRMRARYGTNTSCAAVRAGGDSVVFDAGSGICGYKDLENFRDKRINLFISHYHADHINGFLFWKALFNPKLSVGIYGKGSVKDMLDLSLAPPFCPVGSDVFRANIQFICLNPGGGEIIRLDNGATVSTVCLNHPGGALGYRLDYGGKSVCYMTDVELGETDADEKTAAFAKNADLIISDCAFEDGKQIPGWGHSTPKQCAALAKRAQAKRLALYHYGFGMTDSDIDALEKSAKEIFADTFASADGMKVDI